MAKLYFRYGTMDSAKSLNLLAVAHNYRKQGKRVMLMKPRLDVRFGTAKIASRAGLEADADVMIDEDTTLDPRDFANLDCVLVDEAQFLPPSVIEDLRRITVDPSSDEYMPAESKTPLTERQVEIIHWWIAAGAKNGGTVGVYVGGRKVATLSLAAKRSVAKRFDLAVLCVASHQFVRDAPEWLLERVRPAHVLVGHWEDFFRARSEPLRFVPLLSDGKADAYLERVRTTLGSTGQAVHGPLDPVCGPSEAGFTWPMPGDWLRFHSGSR